MSEIYSHLFEEVDMRLAEAENVGFGFELPVEKASESALLHRLHREMEVGTFQEVAVTA